VQAVAAIFDANVAQVYGLAEDDVVVTIHCGSRGLGHQIGTEFLKEMVVMAELPASRCPTASSPARRSTPKSASAISAPCARQSTARSPIAKSSATRHAACSHIFSQIAS
jgi:RNA-splicing ligase RtcB